MKEMAVSNINELVQVKNEQVVTSSRHVAQNFGKRHDKLFFEIGRMYGELVADKKGIWSFTPPNSPRVTTQINVTERAAAYGARILMRWHSRPY